MMGWYDGGMGPLGWLVMGAVWSAILALMMWLVARLLPGSDGEPTRPAGGSALEIIDRRMASGEIDQETWQARRAALLAAQRDGI